ncbi:MAG: Hsp20/alpha crystallin family protein [Bacillota bacterium]|nr:Hsp20/alpha crystallin family protein [Bacillota bacterium]
MAGLVPFTKKNSGLPYNGFNDFYNMFDDFFNDSWPLKMTFSRETFKVDLEENDAEYLVSADLPGINKDEINLSLNEGRLTISINKEDNINEEKKNYIHKERRYSSMSRSMYLPDAKNDGIKAKLQNGVLSISIPKAEKTDNSIKIKID